MIMVAWQKSVTIGNLLLCSLSVCILERRHATFTGIVYFNCGIVCLYKVFQVNMWGIGGTVFHCQCSCKMQDSVIGKKKWHSTISVTNTWQPRNPSIHTPEVVTDISDHTKRRTHKLMWQLSQQTGASWRSCQHVLHDLWLSLVRSCYSAGTKVTRQGEIVAYCEWLVNIVAKGSVEPFHFFSTD